MPDIAEQDTPDLIEDTQKGKFLTFCMGKEFYGIEIEYVTEIIGMQPITEIPQMPDYIKGIINLRGKIIPVMDVRLRFKKPFREYNDRTCIVVIDIRDVLIGLIVDSVSEVLFIADQEIVAPPNMDNEGNKYIKGIGKVGGEIKLLLDSGLLRETELDTINDL
ncbi:chemotaxis protein CheW [Desulfosporosinus youngiae]|uniref:Chemotaxis signal transduction protein n=1 Tax=Desulfosporosinus youngiae DSM 17734 TaxID=768710 RepID=H5Y5T1_9FIRM|nr:chemotaxis protein CheW [Desulfosporosinus youngiae]EHQ90807.1 chemotaxis signal transduction protein [Desulfosporosinus youngiae DSM 17734]